MFRKRLPRLHRVVVFAVSLGSLLLVIIVLATHRAAQRESAALGAGQVLLVDAPSSAAARATPPAQIQSDATSDPVAQDATDAISSVSVNDHALCIAAKRDVLLVGNRPVGTYLCSYFPTANPISGGCKLPCRSSSGEHMPFTCTILGMGSKQQLKSADIVVNHHGPVPKKISSLEPVMTLFYSGESNISEGKKALHSYQMQYDSVVSFHQHRQWYFTWTNRFEMEFRSVLDQKLQRDWVPWEQRRNAIAIFVSRCKKGGREATMKALGSRYPVHSYGKCHRTHTMDVEFPQCAAMLGGRYPQKLCVFRHYKYVLALDNSRELDYVTEKVYHAFIAGAVPIYDGAPNADAFLPGGWDSVIRLAQYEQPSGGGVLGYQESLQVELRELENASSPKLASLMRWTTATSENQWGERFVANLHHPEPTCDVCDAARHKKCGG